MLTRNPAQKANLPTIGPVQRYGRFLVVGMMNALVDIIVFNVLVLLMPSPSPWLMSIFNTFAVIAAIANSYVWNRHWTFADLSNGSNRERQRFIAQAVLNIVLNDLIVFLASTYLTHFQTLNMYTGGNLSKGLAMFVSSTVSFLILRKFVFKKVTLRSVPSEVARKEPVFRPLRQRHRKWLAIASWGTMAACFAGFFTLWQAVSASPNKPVVRASTPLQQGPGTSSQTFGGRHRHHRDDGFSQFSGSNSNDGNSDGMGMPNVGSAGISGNNGSDFTTSAS